MVFSDGEGQSRAIVRAVTNWIGITARGYFVDLRTFRADSC